MVVLVDVGGGGGGVGARVPINCMCGAQIGVV